MNDPVKYARYLNVLPYVVRGAKVTWYYARNITKRLRDVDFLFLSSGLAFNGILTLIPIMLLMASIVGILLNSSHLGVEQLRDILYTIFPPQPFAAQIRDGVLSMITNIIAYRTSLGLFGVLVLMWTITSLFDGIRSVLHRIYGIRTGGGLLKSLLHDFGFIVLAFLIFLGINLTIWISSLAERVLRDSPLRDVVPIPAFHELVPGAVVVVMTAMMFFILYRYMTNEKPPKRVAIISTLTSTLLWLISGKVFAVYLESVSSIGLIYGPYAFLLVLLFWIYYSSVMFVFGAVVGQVHWERMRALRGLPPIGDDRPAGP
jgi:membrane protein